MSAVPEHAPDEPTDLRGRILREATRLFAEKGYAATSVREVVEAAGCTKPALYYYFRSKDALFIEAIRAETRAMTSIIESSMGRGGSIYEYMRLGIEQFLAHIHENPMGMRLLMRAELQPDEGQPPFDFESLRTHHSELLHGMIRAGVESGEIRPDVDVEDAAYAIAGMVDQRMQLWLRGVAMPEDLPDRLLRIFFHGVAGGPSRGG